MQPQKCRSEQQMRQAAAARSTHLHTAPSYLNGALRDMLLDQVQFASLQVKHAALVEQQQKQTKERAPLLQLQNELAELKEQQLRNQTTMSQSTPSVHS